MKRFSLLIMVATMMLAAVSCGKDDTTSADNNNNTNSANDGVYNPAKKIAECSYWDKWDESWILEESWNWENNKLKSIDHMSYYGEVSWSENYVYQGARIIRVERDDDARYMEFSYTDGRITKASYYYDGQLKEEFKFKYSGERLSEIEGTNYDGYKSSSDEHGWWLLPKHDRNVTDGEPEQVVAKITWQGENISKISASFEEEIVEDYYVYTLKSYVEYTMEHDAKNNPKKGFLNIYSFRNDDESLSAFFNKNNITKGKYYYEAKYYDEDGICVYEDTHTEEYEYSYEYDQTGFPIERTTDLVGEDYEFKEKYEYLK